MLFYQNHTTTVAEAMGFKCCVPDFTSGYASDTSVASMFKFPYDSTLHGLWLKDIHRINAEDTLWTPTDCNRVCSNHFLEEDFQMESCDGKK